MLRFSFEIPEGHGPALRSVVEEMCAELEPRLEQSYSYPIEDALCGAMNALGALRAAVFAQVAAGDPYFRGRRA